MTLHGWHAAAAPAAGQQATAALLAPAAAPPNHEKSWPADPPAEQPQKATSQSDAPAAGQQAQQTRTALRRGAVATQPPNRETPAAPPAPGRCNLLTHAPAGKLWAPTVVSPERSPRPRLCPRSGAARARLLRDEMNHRRGCDPNTTLHRGKRREQASQRPELEVAAAAGPGTWPQQRARVTRAAAATGPHGCQHRSAEASSNRQLTQSRHGADTKAAQMLQQH